MIIIVSGLPRSGTSMMMKMLSEGGLPVLIDKDNPSTDLNPGGAYAYEPTKTLNAANNGWFTDADGKAVKVTAYFLMHLLPKLHYKILYMEREPAEVEVSQNKMFEELGIKGRVNASILEATNKSVKQWLSKQPNMDVMLVNYNKLINDPAASLKDISDFIGFPLNESKAEAVPDKRHYRNRKAK